MKVISNVNISYHCRKDDRFYEIRPDILTDVPDYVVEYLKENYRNNFIICEGDNLIKKILKQQSIEIYNLNLEMETKKELIEKQIINESI